MSPKTKIESPANNKARAKQHLNGHILGEVVGQISMNKTVPTSNKATDDKITTS